MELRERRLDPWIVVPLGAVAAVTGIDLVTGSDLPLIAALILGPLLASVRLNARYTAAVAVVALLVSFLLGFANDFFGESGHLTRILPVALAGVLAVWLARLQVARERTTQLLAVQGSASRILNESGTLRDAAPRLLEVIGETLRLQIGTMWVVDRQAGRLRPFESWTAPRFEAPAFEATSREVGFERGVGLPGRVWARGGPVSLRELEREGAFQRAAEAAEAGLKGGFGFPVRAGDSVVGVIDLYGTRLTELDRGRLEMFAGLGRQIGEFMERRRAEEQRAELLEREHQARLDAERAERRAAETVALLDTLLGRAPVGFAFIDTDLRYVRVNDALAAMDGRTSDEMVGRTLSEVTPDLPQVLHTVRRVITSGEAVTDVELSGQTGVAPGVERHWIQSYYPVRGVGGEIMGVGAVVVEITERKRAETRANFLAEATAALNASLDYEVTLANIARLTVPHLADWCVVDIVEPKTHRIRRLAIAHSDPSKEQLLWEIDRRYPLDPEGDAGAAAAIRTGELQHYDRVDDSLMQAAARDEEHLRIIRELELTSAISVPLRARGEAFGAVTFATAESHRVFGSADVALVEELAARAGAAVENARLYAERSHIARTLQESLLPPRLPDMPGVELAARYRAAGEATDVGGDFYDVFPTGEQSWGAVVGDVLGKGAAAAAMIGLARHTLRAAAMREPDSVSVLTTLNEALYREGAEESFCTAAYLAIDVADDLMHVELTCAGHPLPLLLHPGGTLERVGRPGTLLGAVPRLTLEPHRISLAAGDALVVFTDGVVEARSEQEVFGETRLRRLLRELPKASARELAERVMRHAIDFQAGRLRDDLAVLVARRRADQAPPPLEAPGAAAPEAIRTDA